MTAILEPISSPEIIFYRPKMSSGKNNTAARSPDRGSVQRIAANALQTKSVTVDRLYGTLFRTFKLQPHPDFFYILRCRPSSNIRLLRHEEDRLQAEAFTLQALRGRSDILIPRLIECSQSSSASMIGSPYIISGPFKGSLLLDVEPGLSKQALATIDRSLGTFVRRLTYVSGTHFGSLRSGSTSSSSSWSRCFTSMLESLLQDTEDALINLPYDFIRDQVRRHRNSLDQITQPKLVLLEVVNDQNILVDPKTLTISGILDFSSAIWGDPFMSDAFYNPRMGFVEGFGKLPNGSSDERIRQYL